MGIVRTREFYVMSIGQICVYMCLYLNIVYVPIHVWLYWCNFGTVYTVRAKKIVLGAQCEFLYSLYR